MKPSVVYLTSRMPYPPTSGGQRHEYELLRRMQDRADVHLRVVTQHAKRDSTGLGEMRRRCASVEMVAARPPAVPPARTPERVWRQACPEMRDRVAELIDQEKPDLVHVEGYYMLQHVPREPGVPVVLVEENVEFVLDRQREALGLGQPGGWREARRLETRAWRSVAACGAISEGDAGLIRKLMPEVNVHWCPHGFEPRRVLGAPADAGVDDGPVTVMLLGSYSYPPTEDAALHLIADVWPLVLPHVDPRTRLLIVGAAPTARLRAVASLSDRVEVVGEVESVATAYARAHIAVAPIRIGGGVKVKVLEAIEHGCPVVASSLGAEGLPREVRDALSIGRDANEIGAHIVALAGDRGRRRTVAVRAASAAAALPSWREAVDRLWALWSDGMNGAMALESERMLT